MASTNLSEWEINFIWYVDFPHGEYFSDPAYRRKIITRLLQHHDMEFDDYVNAYPEQYKEYCKKYGNPKVKNLSNA